MHKKYFFFDIDGTLSTGLTTMMPESAVQALAQLRANGHFTAIATGRLQASAATVAARYGFTDIVADGGWSVTHNGEIVEMESLPAADCIALIERLEQAGIPWAVSPENEKLCVTTDKNYLPYAPENYFPVLWDPHFDYHRLEHLYKVYYVCTPDEEKHIDAGGLPLVRYNPHVIFVEPKEKQRGIRYFQQLLSIPDEDIVVYSMSDTSEPKDGYKMYLPIGSGMDSSQVSVYCYTPEGVKYLESSTQDRTVIADSDSIRYVAVVKGKRAADWVKWLGLALVALAVIAAVLGFFYKKRQEKRGA